MDQAINIQSAYSAQRSTAPPSPRLVPALSLMVRQAWLDPDEATVCDQGCGRLRHLDIILGFSKDVVLVDQDFQLGRKGLIFNETNVDITTYVAGLRASGYPVSVMNSRDFQASKLGLDLVVSVAVLDVLPPHERETVLEAAASNLSPGGCLLLIVPRNDSSILVRCTKDREFDDGHVFHHHGAWTFYKNFRDVSPLTDSLVGAGFRVCEDMSVYRHVCLIAQRL